MFLQMRLLCFLLFIGVSPLFAQKNVLSDDQNLLWTRYLLQLNITPKVYWVSEADNRVFLKNIHQNQFITHHHLHYRINDKIETSLGYTFSSQKSQLPDVENSLAVPERRLFQEFYIRQILSSKVRFQHRFRSEERFFRHNDGKVLLSGYDFNWRYRYQAQLIYQINTKVLAKVSDELMLNFGKKIVYNTFDQNRLYIGIETQISKNISAELGYMRLFQQRNKGNEYLLRNNFRFTLYHRINLQKDKYLK